MVVNSEVLEEKIDFSVNGGEREKLQIPGCLLLVD